MRVEIESLIDEYPDIIPFLIEVYATRNGIIAIIADAKIMIYFLWTTIPSGRTNAQIKYANAAYTIN